MITPRSRIGRVQLLAGLTLTMITATPMAAQAAAPIPYRCPLAPIQGPICQYVDPRLLQVLAGEAVAEALRWGTLEALRPKIEQVLTRTELGKTVIAQFDTVLRGFKTPRVPVPDVFAAAWNLGHPSAIVQLVVSNGQSAFVNFGELAKNKVDALQALGEAEPTRIVAASIAQLSLIEPSYGSAGVGKQLFALYEREQGARIKDSVAAVEQTKLATQIRARSSGMQGESEARLLTAQGAIDLLRTTAEGQRSDASANTIDGMRAAQSARAAKTAMLLKWATVHGVVTP